MPTKTQAELLELFSNATIIVQGENSYRVDCIVDFCIYVTDEDTGDEHILEFDDVDLSRDLVYGLKLLNTND
jgi:hypothetical protein